MFSPFRYAGGKYYARKHILEVIPAHDYYVEPFAGGASIFFAKDKATKNWLNDKDSYLINCLRVIRDYPNELIQFLDGKKATQKNHTKYKEKFMDMVKADNINRQDDQKIDEQDIVLAGLWFYLNRTSYSGVMNMQNCYWGYGEKYSMPPKRWPKRIMSNSKKLQSTYLTAYDFEDVINKVPENSFLFIDPPYYRADQDRIYTHSFVQRDHERLAQILEQHTDRINFLLTYDNHPDIHEMYAWCFNILEREWTYRINRSDQTKKTQNTAKGKKPMGEEIFIINYAEKKYNQMALGL